MTRQRTESFICSYEGRVDRASGDLVPRSVFSLPDTSIIVEGRPVKKSFRVRPGDHVCVTWTEEVFDSIQPEDIPLSVIYEDESILVIDKPAGMVVHPGAGNWSGTLVNALLHRYGEDFSTCIDEDDEEVSSMDLPRPGIVHRLDKDTSGVMVIARTAQAHRSLCSQFALHSTEKVYIAVVKGLFAKKRGTVDAPIVRKAQDRRLFATSPDPRKGKSAVTHYTVLRQAKGHAFLRVRIETGRTHQIRVHMQSIGHPIVGDPLYSRPDPAFKDVGLCLHALSLTIDHPVTGERMTFRSGMPRRIRGVLEEILA